MTPFNIEAVAWGAPSVVQTRQGRRRVRQWTIPHNANAFWAAWRTGYLRQQGYSVGKWNDEWQLTEWRNVDGSEPRGVSRAVAGAIDRTVIAHRAEQVVPELPIDMARRFAIVEDIYDEIERETGTDFRYQLPHIKRLAVAVDAFDGGLDSSDTGTGKTPVACAVAKVLGRWLFVVCPKNVMRPWKRMAKRFGVPIRVINYEMLRTGNTEYAIWQERESANGKTYMTFDYSNKFNPDRVLFVFDECHRMKDYTTLNCQMGVAAQQAGFKVLGLSATAADNPLHMKFVGLLTGLIDHPTHFHGWLKSQGVLKGRFGLEFVGGRDVMSRLHKRIFPARGSRMRIADLGERFPQTQIVSEAYDMGAQTSAAIARIYEQMHEAIAELEAKQRRDVERNTQANILVQILRARQKVELLKVPTFVQMAADGLAEGNAVIVVLNYQQSVLEVSKSLRTTNTITGEDKLETRQRLIDRFNADDEDTVVLNIKAGGLGIDLHGTTRGKPRLVIISPTYSGIDLKQALGRAHRAGGAHSVQKIVWAADTIEERVCEKVRERLHRVSIFNDDNLDSLLTTL